MFLIGGEMTDRSKYWSDYYQANKAHYIALRKVYRSRNRDKTNRSKREWYARNRELVNLAARCGITVKQARRMKNEQLARVSRRWQQAREARVQ